MTNDAISALFTFSILCGVTPVLYDRLSKPYKSIPIVVALIIMVRVLG